MKLLQKLPLYFLDKNQKVQLRISQVVADNLFPILQTDVSGECDVEYKMAGQTWATRTITKSKDMLSCSGHQHLHSIIQSTPYRVSSVSQLVNYMSPLYLFYNNFHLNTTSWNE